MACVVGITKRNPKKEAIARYINGFTNFVVFIFGVISLSQR
jgi:hypothetical protein